MTKYTFFAILGVVSLATILALGWVAWLGNVAAGIALGALGAIACIIIGVGITILTSWALARNQQAAFTANAKENMQIMGAMQTVQNRQNAMLLKQAQAAQNMLPSGNGETIDVDFLEIDADVFSELE